MPPRIPVELVPHSSQWAIDAEAEGVRLLQVFSPNTITVHHIGSTAIPGIPAKPILDLLPVVNNLIELDQQLSLFQELDYEYWGEYGIPGRRYCTLNDPISSKRRIQLHCFEKGSPEIERHLTFRDYLRANPQKAQEYASEKERCRNLHPDDSHAYSDAKAEWISKILPEATAWFRNSHPTLGDQPS